MTNMNELEMTIVFEYPELLSDIAVVRVGDEEWQCT